MFIIREHGIRIRSCLINCHRQLLPIHEQFLSLIGRLCIFMRHILTSHLYDIAYLGLFIFGSYLDLTQPRSLAILQSSSRMTLWAILYIICLCLFPYIIFRIYQTNIPFTFAVLFKVSRSYLGMHIAECMFIAYHCITSAI